MNYELKEYKILGYTTDFNVCDCCGKADLKGTISILAVNYDVVLHFGTTCAAKADKYDTLEAARKAKKEISSVVREFDEMRKCAGSWANKQVKHIRISKGLTFDNCMEDQEYISAWKAEMESKYRQLVAVREAREAEKTRLANRTPEQVMADEQASRERWEKWRAERELNYAE